jgi:hypothetical protein
MINLFQFLLKVRSSQKSPKLNSSSGMTMIELLVGTVIAFIIITPLMGMVIGLLNDDSREQAKATTDEEINSALQYISDDMSQATYIYDKKGITALLNQGANAIIPAATADSTPILVFWKRKLVENGIPVSGQTITSCKYPNADDTKCDDTYVLSLVAYYLDKSNNATFCPSDGGACPARITRFEIQDGVKDLAGNPLCEGANANNCGAPQRREPGFPTSVNTTQLTSVTKELNEQIPNVSSLPVLVNYIDISTANVPPTATCTNVLGIDTTNAQALKDRNFANATEAQDAVLVKTNSFTGSASFPDSKSFYACVDSHANVAQIYLRGNALRRIQKDANYSPNSPALFPTATMQVRGLGTFGKQ